MDPAITAHLTAQQGLILRRQALAAGLSPYEIKALLRSGDWVAVRWGVYTTAAIWSALDPYAGRAGLEARAACLNMIRPHVLSHDSAAYLQGLPILEAEPRLVHITRFDALGGRTHFGVKHHKAPFRSDQIDFVDEQPVLDLPRTVADIAREHGVRHGIVAASSALRAGVSRRALEEAIEPMRCWRHVTAARQSVAWADGGCESPGEALAMLLLKQLGVGPVCVQFGMQEGGRVAWVDLRVGRHLVEFDGRQKYVREERGGLAGASVDEVVWREKKRQDWLCGFKLGMSRLTWVDLLPRHWTATAQRLLREISATQARFGSSIEDLAPYVIRRAR